MLKIEVIYITWPPMKSRKNLHGIGKEKFLTKRWLVEFTFQLNVMDRMSEQKKHLWITRISLSPVYCCSQDE